MLFRTQIIFCSSELRLHFRIAEVGSLLSLNRAWRAQVTLSCSYLEECCYLLHVSRNHQGRRGTTADIGDNLLPSLTVLGCSLTAVEVETGPLFDVVFPSFLVFPFFFSLVLCLVGPFCRGHLIWSHVRTIVTSFFHCC